MKRQFLCLMIFLSMQIGSIAQASDWRKTGSEKQKLNNVVKVIPGASNIMLQMGERYKNLYWAGMQEKWQFAEYQVEEMQSLIKTLMITRPKRAATAEKFLKEAFVEFPVAMQNKSWSAFTQAFEHMRQACMVCHVKNDHAFIILSKKPNKASSPVFN